MLPQKLRFSRIGEAESVEGDSLEEEGVGSKFRTSHKLLNQ